MIRRPPISTLSSSSAASDVYKRQAMVSSYPVASWSRSQTAAHDCVPYNLAMIAIVNPAAAGGRLGNNWPRLRRRLQAAGFDPPLAFTEAPGHATAVAADAVRRGETLVVAAGGGFPLTPAATT